MSLGNQFIVVVISYLLSFLYIRGFLWGVKAYTLNTSARKKRKKGQTFKEWFLYSRYREEIPKVLLIWYFVVMAIHPLVLLFCIILYFIDSLEVIGAIFAKGIFWFDGVWIITIQLLFWQVKPGFKYERWIEKKGGNKKN